MAAVAAFHAASFVAAAGWQAVVAVAAAQGLPLVLPLALARRRQGRLPVRTQPTCKPEFVRPCIGCMWRGGMLGSPPRSVTHLRQIRQCAGTRSLRPLCLAVIAARPAAVTMCVHAGDSCNDVGKIMWFDATRRTSTIELRAPLCPRRLFTGSITHTRGSRAPSP